ncbi:hypothetical protein LOD99_13682 [Oopsacas minuta]|uniref:Uncharacterized protein n=1 Tax=Oopsacas minuta TaxID=111878 RepID=A0AAV7KIH6_9METZ|nr:hypothetical protein LOD99_13682 [Oopsacas minuta]
MYSKTHSRLGYIPVLYKEPETTLQWVRKPENQFNIEGGYAIFTLAVAGAGSIRYRWYNPSGQLMQEYRPFLEINKITNASFGEYRVEVRNNLGEMITAEAGLWKEKRVIQSPYKLVKRIEPFYDLPIFNIICQPVPVSAGISKRAELSVTVEGVAPKFQWYHMDDYDRPIHGQTSSKLIIEEVQDFNYGIFYVKIKDLFGQTLQSIPTEIREPH